MLNRILATNVLLFVWFNKEWGEASCAQNWSTIPACYGK